MNSIRVKVTPTVEADGTVHLRIEWLDVAEGEEVRSVLFTEDCAIGPARAGTGYVSRVKVPEAEVGSVAFMLEPSGRRHLLAFAEPGRLQSHDTDADMLALAERGV